MLKTKKSPFGSYDLCRNCNDKTCCSGYDSAILTLHDLKNIINNGYIKDEFSQIINYNGKLIQVLKKKKKSTYCIFWDEKQKKCSIYDIRPFDCQMFPFDVNYFHGEYYWVVYSCNNSGDWKWTEDYLVKLEKNPQFNIIMNYIDENKIYSSFEFDESQDFDYKIIRKVIWNPRKITT